jgi:hypothetical protein
MLVMPTDATSLLRRGKSDDEAEVAAAHLETYLPWSPIGKVLWGNWIVRWLGSRMRYPVGTSVLSAHFSETLRSRRTGGNNRAASLGNPPSPYFAGGNQPLSIGEARQTELLQ